MATIMQGPSSFDTMNAINAGGKNSAAFAGFMHYFVMMKGAEKAAILQVLGDGQNVGALQSFSQITGLAEKAFGAAGWNSGLLVLYLPNYLKKKIYGQM